MDLPISYSLFDLIQIIKTYTNYSDSHDWVFVNPREPHNTVSLQNDREEILGTKFGSFKNISPHITCTHGPIVILIGVRGGIKYRKVYPTIYQAVGKFPTIEEFSSGLEISGINIKYNRIE